MVQTHAYNYRDNTSLYLVSGALVFFLSLALLIARYAADQAMEVQSWTFIGLAMAFLLGTIFWASNNADRNPFDEAEYEDTIVKWGVIASVFWGLAGLLVGLIIALQLTFPNIFYFPELGW